MAIRGINGATVTIVVSGGILLYSGLRGTKITDIVRDLLAGRQPSTTPDASLALGSPDASSAVPTMGEHSGDQVGSLNSSGFTPGGGTRSENMAKAALLAAPYGWAPGTADWAALVKLWDKESSWSNTADNPSSHAYGIAQALPSTKYPLMGRPPREGGSSSAVAQITWGLQYIKGRYGSPSAAWAHEVANNWY